MKQVSDSTVVCVIGLGYVGFPLAEAFAKSFRVVGFDIDKKKLKRLAETNTNRNLILTSKKEDIRQADFIIVCVPTPVTESKDPDLSYVNGAATVAGQNMKKGCVVVFESTYYPGVTEDIVKPILEKESGLKCGKDFKIGYSPERINPGDTEHTIDRITKVVAGMDEETTELLASLYGKAAARVFKAENIKTAEAAKVIENIQRDLNIALMNELSLIFNRMGLSINSVLDAAATKWNFHKYSPGLVGGHCIGVDPYYLVYKALQIGYNPQVITSGRKINNYMAQHVSEQIIEMIKTQNKKINGSTIMIMGLTFKENVNDTRNSKAKDIIKFLKNQKINVIGFEPLVDKKTIENEFGIKNIDFQKAKNIDGIIIFSPHEEFKKIKLKNLKNKCAKEAIFFDIKGFYNKKEVEKEGFNYKRL